MKSKPIFISPLILFLLTALFFSCTPSNEPFTKSQLVLGTVCSITLYGPNNREAGNRLFEELERLEELLSAHLDSSEVARVNRAAGQTPQVVGPEMLAVINEGLDYGRFSDGAFDITAGPLVDLWGIGSEDARVPSKTEIQSVLPLIDYAQIVLNQQESTVYLPNPGMGLDLGGIAKGYASDFSAEFLREQGIAKGILNFGGNVYVIGQKSEDKKWRAAVQNPFSNRGQWIGYIDLADTALVTSGKYERFLEQDGVRYHHILDPETGFPSENGVASVTIAHRKGIAADALSTAVFLMGLNDGLVLLESLPEAEGIIIMENKEVYLTSGIAEFVVTDEEFHIVNLDS